MDSFICFMGKVLEPLGQVAVSLIAAFRENGERARALRTSQRERDEWKTRCLAAESRLQTTEEKSTKLWAVIVVLFVTVLFCVFFPNRTVLVGAVGLSFALGGLVLPEANRLGQCAHQGLRRTASLWQSVIQRMRPVFLRFGLQMRDRIRDWKWKSIPASQSFRSTP